MDTLYLDLLNLIFNKLDFLNQIRLKQVCKFYYNNLHIIDLYNIDYKYKKLLNDEILKNYHYIKYLDVWNNPKIKNISHMKNLKKLHCSDYCSISNEDIKDLDLIELYANNNPKITNINHMKNLKKLNCSDTCAISDKVIKDLDLIELYAGGN